MKEKIILTQDQTAIDKMLSSYEARCSQLNKLCHAMNAAGFPVESKTHLNTILEQSAEAYIKNKLMEGAQLSLNGLKLSKEAVAGIVALPDLTEVKAAEFELNKEKKLREYYLKNEPLKLSETTVVSIDSFVFIDGNFNVSEKIKQQAIDKHTSYVTNDKQRQLLIEGAKVVEAANEFYKKFGIMNIALFNDVTDEWELNKELIANIPPEDEQQEQESAPISNSTLQFMMDDFLQREKKRIELSNQVKELHDQGMSLWDIAAKLKLQTPDRVNEYLAMDVNAPDSEPEQLEQLEQLEQVEQLVEQEPGQREHLLDRVQQLSVKGLTQREISRELNISLGSVNNYLKHF